MQVSVGRQLEEKKTIQKHELIPVPSRFSAQEMSQLH
jgi:hypothetical protein